MAQSGPIPTSFDRKLDALKKHVEEHRVHTIDRYFIIGMLSKRTSEHGDFLVEEISAIEQLYHTLVHGV